MTRSQSPNHKGNVAELAIAAAAAKLGVEVSKPLGEHTRYDLVFGTDAGLFRIQCKWASRRGAVIPVNLAGCSWGPSGYVRSVYAAHEIDAIGVYCDDLDQCFLLPIERFAGMRAVHLRLEPPKNGQIAALNWAAEYTLSGAVAQLGERCRGTAEATGSSPVSSMQHRFADELVGAHQFRERFGSYMQRAAAGETFLVTRRGKPYVRLEPALDQPSLPTRLRESMPR